MSSLELARNMKLKSLFSASKHSVARLARFTLGAVCVTSFLTGTMQAAPYASHVQVNGTNVSFILNQPADGLGYRINNGAFQSLDGSTKGSKSFSLTSPTDTFAILAVKNETNGYTVLTGGTIATNANGLSQPSDAGGFNPISDDANSFNRYNSPRGVSVSNDPRAANFGTAYIANSAAGTTTGVVRSLGDGLYAVNADQTDAFGYVDTAQDPENRFDGVGASSSSPFRVFAAANGEVYTADFSDANGTVYRANGDLTAPADGTVVLAGIGGPSTLPVGQNHGSTTGVFVKGSLANGDLVVYTLDEDLPASGSSQRNSLWRYDINAGPLPFAGLSNRVNQANLLLPAATSDLQVGADGKFYLAQNRSGGAEAGIFVLGTDGVKLFDSLTATRTLLGNPTAIDILRNILAMAVSEDQKWMALMLNNSDVAVVPLVDGIPDIANRRVVDTGTDVNSGRDIAFDAAGNIHYVSSGQALYRVLAPGGSTWATTAWNGTAYTFNVATSPALSVTTNGNQLQIAWTAGILQEASSLSGGWVDSATQTSPYVLAPTDAMKFYRVRSP